MAENAPPDLTAADALRVVHELAANSLVVTVF
jgi:hypothetical protein